MIRVKKLNLGDAKHFSMAPSPHIEKTIGFRNLEVLHLVLQSC